MSEYRTFPAGSVTVHIVEDETAMGEETARKVADQLLRAETRGQTPVLWVMAAPSAFAFYRSFIKRTTEDPDLRTLVRHLKFYQFDDYPVSRTDARFAVTFRALLEEHLYGPLEEVCGHLGGIHPLELTGGPGDGEMARAYADELAGLLEDEQCFVVQVKGIGMDGHWGFHGADTPLDTPAGVIEVPIGSQNVRQQRIDWPELFRSDADVPPTAFTATVKLFLQADYIIDNVPQHSKQYAVLATYGNDEITSDIPSTALKNHGHAEAILTRAASGALLEYRDRLARGHATLSESAITTLDSLWDDPGNPEAEAHNRRIMRDVLSGLGMMD